MSKKDKKIKNRTGIGGQAVLEGVMMLGKSSMATAVRDPDGEIQIESKRISKNKHLSRASKIPCIVTYTRNENAYAFRYGCGRRRR